MLDSGHAGTLLYKIGSNGFELMRSLQSYRILYPIWNVVMVPHRTAIRVYVRG